MIEQRTGSGSNRDRQIDLIGRALADIRFYREQTVMFFDDGITHGQTEPRPF